MPHHRLSHPFPLTKTNKNTKNKQQKSKEKKREETKRKYDDVLTGLRLLTGLRDSIVVLMDQNRSLYDLNVDKF